MLKSATLYKPAAMKPNIAELVTAPATLRMTNVNKTITANASYVGKLVAGLHF